MTLKQSLFVVGSIASVVTGCAHSTTNLNKVSTTKTAAIIAFSGSVSLQDENSSGQISGMVGGIQALKDINSDETAALRLQEATTSYDAVAQKLTGLGWNVLPRDQVTANPEMQKLFVSKMGQRRVNAGMRFGIPNVLWADVGDLSADDQRALKTALGVDALVVVQDRVMTGRTYGWGANGEGRFEVYPKAILAFAAYDGTGGPFWSEPGIQGPNANGKVIRTMGKIDQSTEAAPVAEATQLAMDVLVQRVAPPPATAATQK